MGLFRRRPCEVCKAKDEELAFLRGMLSSSRTIVREPDSVQVVQPAVSVPVPMQSGVVQNMEGDSVFTRNTTTWDVVVPTEGGGPVGEDEIRLTVEELQAERRAALAARRGQES